VFDGTWASGPLPEEIQDYLLAKHMRLSWRDVIDMPDYVRRVWWDLMQAELGAQAEAARAAEARREREQRARA
jgi:hypothetical protein